MKTVCSFFLIVFILLGSQAGYAQQKKYTAPALNDSGSWTMIMLPDPQSYNKYERNQPLFELMTAWVSSNIDALNIKLVICTGDLVEYNEMINPDGINSDQPSKKQWEAVSRSFSRLDGKVPYLLAAGNHDYGYTNISVRRSNYNKYFPVDKNFKTQKLVREVALNAEGIPTLENAAYEFVSPGGRKFLFFTLNLRRGILYWRGQKIQVLYSNIKIIQRRCLRIPISAQKTNTLLVKTTKYRKEIMVLQSSKN